MKPYFATSIADNKGVLFDKLQALLPLVLDRFQGIGVLLTNTTDDRIVKLLQEADAFIDRAESNIDAIGMHRRRSVALVLENSTEGHILRTDADHLLRWIEQDAEELDLVLERMKDTDLTVIGRGPKSFAALPKRLKDTESIVNHIFALITGLDWDLLMGSRGISRRAAELIVNESCADTVGNDMDWPLLCWKHGVNLDYVEAEGLTYQTEYNYAHNLEDSKDLDPEAWMLRMKLAQQNVEAMQPYIKQ